MTDSVLWDKLTAIFRETMDNPSITLSESTTASDISEWDSITHVLLMVAVEKKFGVKFTATEIQTLQNVGQLAALVEKRLQ